MFKGDRKTTETFLTKWELYRGMNRHTQTMREAYSRALLFLTFLEGDDLNEWITTFTRWLTLQITNGIPENDERIWNSLYRSFQRRFTNTMEKENA